MYFCLVFCLLTKIEKNLREEQRGFRRGTGVQMLWIYYYDCRAMYRKGRAYQFLFMDLGKIFDKVRCDKLMGVLKAK